MIRAKYHLMLVSGLLLILWCLQTMAQQTGSIVTKYDSVAEDLYLAGGTVQLLTDVSGDAVIAGGSVTVAKRVGSDLLVAGGAVTISGDVGDDVRAAGGTLTVAGNVGGDMVAAAGSVTLGPDATVSGRAWLSGGSVHVAGHITNELRVAAGTVVLTGQVDGDVRLLAESIEMTPTAVITGDLTYSSPNELVAAQGARIDGVINREESDMFPSGHDWGGRIVSAIVFCLSLAVSAMVVSLLFPDFSRSSILLIEHQPLTSLGIGLLVLVVTPIAIVVFCASVLGIPLGMALLALYLVVLLAGFLVALTYVGRIGFKLIGKESKQSRGSMSLSILAAAGLVLVVSVIPVLGTLALFGMLLLGVGALAAYSYRCYTRLKAENVPAPSVG
ncbi:MAG: polymer-forming cytoskeletal protein [Gammaproteobacteria bacterium]|nr:polymer-forming cytoskeletal protein [Gammaproteobacteria bacterium]